MPVTGVGLDYLLVSAKRGMPDHVAIIMDGNGRWALSHGLERSAGHQHGVRPLQESIEVCVEQGIRYLTVYAFSTENWNRPSEEVDRIMGLLLDAVSQHTERFAAEGIRVCIIGERGRLSAEVREAVEYAERLTAGGDRLVVQIALNYGGRTELVHAARGLAREVASGSLGWDEIEEHHFSSHLYTSGVPDPDLLIRTSGEVRLSNFLLWQLAYAEFVFLPVLGPDFRKSDFLMALDEYSARHRRYGGVS